MTAASSRRGPRKGDQRERSLLDAARRIFQTKPLGSVTVDELAAGAGLARSGFYFYFESKHAVLAALCNEVVGDSDRDLADWLSQQGPAPETLRIYLSHSLARWRSDGLWLSEAFIRPDPPPELASVRERIERTGCEQLAERIGPNRGATVPPAQALLIARMVLNLKNITFAQWSASEAAGVTRVGTEAELLSTLADTILRMMYWPTDPALARS